ncbi:ArnT family glycosyltransferase [Paenibacillus polymyxa]|uniref:ArnT family glycosyltransferase n=1 Tax=Paenibacillus polymyxa TaxID=1406 RepID=UPI000C9FAD1F|nr:glycosyltransferase family 39 protein [Paenibacillus polymyxa]PNQ85054.1 hypothetical protein C1T20_14935 [Paenibacillus polymyxa]
MKIEIYSTKFTAFLCFIIFSTFFLINFYKNFYIYGFSNILLFCSGIIISFLMIYKLLNFFSQREFIIVLLMFCFFLRVTWILSFKTPLESDFKIMFEGALQAATGDFRFTELPYFLSYPYQLGYTLYQSLVIQVFGQTAFVIKLLNVVYSCGTALMIYLIVSILFNEKAGRIGGMIYAINIPNIVLSSVLTNQHLASFVFYLSFYLIISNYSKKRYSGIVIGSLLSLGNIIRPVGPVLLIAIILYYLISKILKKENFSIRNTLCILSSYFIIHAILSYALILSGVTNYSLENRDPLWKFVTGLNAETVGMYSSSDSELLGKYSLGNVRNEKSLEVIKERLLNNHHLFLLFSKKYSLMWGEEDTALYWSLNQLNEKKVNLILSNIDRIIYMSSFVFAIIASIFIILRKNIKLDIMLVQFFVIGYILIHLIIEVQTRYRYEIIPSFTILEAIGIGLTGQYIKKKYENARLKFKGNNLH